MISIIAPFCENKQQRQKEKKFKCQPLLFYFEFCSSKQISIVCQADATDLLQEKKVFLVLFECFSQGLSNIHIQGMVLMAIKILLCET